jgi:hypothetical protein
MWRNSTKLTRAVRTPPDPNEHLIVAVRNRIKIRAYIKIKSLLGLPSITNEMLITEIKYRKDRKDRKIEIYIFRLPLTHLRPKIIIRKFM